ncbi:MAG: LptF/LptG family permease [Arcobacteraceae bacterium]|nr:LptF/LptG family permease [Arcobacteraceae bacterium]
MKLNQYIYSQLSLSFFPIFFGLFFITSIIFLVRIAALTSVITMNVLELFTLYLYSVPNILFYTLPISFFIALVIALGKLSSEYELIVITSFGLNPIKILKIFFPVTLILSISLIIVSLGLIPKTKFLTNEMLDFKKREANFNIKSSEYGQKFGEWMIYIDNKKDKVYDEVKLFKTNSTTDEFIISKSATLNNHNSQLSFELSDGKLFNIKANEINQVDFKTMLINESISNKESEHFTTSWEYWTRHLYANSQVDKFTFYILISFFPLISLFLVIAFGYYNPRYEKNRSVGLSVMSIVVFYLITDYAVKHIFWHALYAIPLVWLLVCYVVYQKKIQRVY